jgi:hypothetical protein
MANKMYSQKYVRFILLLAVLHSATMSGEAFASPASYSEDSKTDERIEYAVSLNSIASTLMNWYGSLITTKNTQTGEQQANVTNIRFTLVDQSWNDYRTVYPERIIGIQIMSADMKKQDSTGQYQFEVDVLMTYMQSGTPQNKLFHEIFLFQTSDSSKSEIIQITRLTSHIEKSTSDTSQIATFKRHYYKSREFAYAWLAYMDGVKAMGSRINIDYWLDRAFYSVNIGDFELDEKVASSLPKRNQYMGKGGHLLRSVTTKMVEDKPHHFELDIIIDWKGTDPSGILAIAKINQVIQYKVLEDGSWVVLSIKEKHLLPDLQPWQKLLC